MAHSSIPTHPTVALEWRTGYQHRGIEPVDASGLDYLLDGDDPIARAARANVMIFPTDPVVAAVAERSGLDYNETAGILDGFMAALDRAEGGAA